MILEIDDWKFEVDAEYTRQYNGTIEQCQCCYDRNFYSAIDLKYPQLRPFLLQFGVDVVHPEEIFSIEQEEDPIDYIAYYTVKGKILQLGGYEIDVGHAHILPQYRNEVMLPNPDCDKDDPESYFVLSVMDIALPWVLDEPMPKGLPPIKTWLDKFIDKLFRRKQ